jgi:hypothetical protein
MGWDEKRYGEPTLLEYLRYYRGGEIGEVHIEAAIQAHLTNKLSEIDTELRKWVEYNKLDMGEMSEFIRTKYVYNKLDALATAIQEAKK